MSAFAHFCVPSAKYPALHKTRAQSIFVEWGKQMLNLPGAKLLWSRAPDGGVKRLREKDMAKLKMVGGSLCL